MPCCLYTVELNERRRQQWGTAGGCVVGGPVMSCQSDEAHFTLNVFQRVIERRHWPTMFFDELWTHTHMRARASVINETTKQRTSFTTSVSHSGLTTGVKGHGSASALSIKLCHVRWLDRFVNFYIFLLTAFCTSDQHSLWHITPAFPVWTTNWKKAQNSLQTRRLVQTY